MKIFVLVFLFATTALSDEFTDCRTAKETNLRLMPGTIPSGALAVDYEGKPVGLKEILSDEMIRFKISEGNITETYQWMYGFIRKVEGRDDKYLSTS
jgi:hypothetical protein